MPPHVPRKRLRGSPDSHGVKDARGANHRSTAVNTHKRKATLYDDLDATATPLSSKTAGSLFQSANGDSSESSLTSLSDEDFEDVPLAKRQKPELDGSSDDDDELEFEDVEAPAQSSSAVPVVSGDLELTLNRDTRISLNNIYGDKKGPSKRERRVRNATHCLHVLSLLWHNAVRNSWICDPEVQAIMVSHLPPRMWEEVERWRRNSGLEMPQKQTQRSGRKGKARADSVTKGTTNRKSRDWGSTAERLEEGVVDMSHGDPLFRLMQSLSSWWKQRFQVSVPGLRKWGYMSLERLDRLTKSYQHEFADSDRFGERIPRLEGFRQCASTCRGSRDVGSQLFTALVRGLGLDARMVSSLQPLGFGWSKWEDADPEDGRETTQHSSRTRTKETKISPKRNIANAPAKPSTRKAPPRKSQHSKSGVQQTTSSDEQTDLRPDYMDTDDELVVGVEITPKRSKAAARRVDADLEYPHYWTEILSPVTSKFLPIDPITKGSVATNRDIIESFEPRGLKADRAHQVTAYIVGYSQDGTAKDITVRYLKRQIWPGRTKGMRMPPQKVPIYNRHGKVKRYEEYDWFKSAMSGYRRGTRAYPITEIDEDEDATDLKAAKQVKKEVKEGEETLQYYKQSKEFVLERHLRREEALIQGAVPVKKFRNKGKGGKVDEEDVYLRSDAVQVKSAETWHKQGRAPIPREKPLKRVPYRAATTNRRREILEVEAATGEKVLQGLYSFEQTDWIIPAPIQNGVIPKNEYG